jgi:tetratricopeptide (TPR) repeat protein
LEEPEEVLNLAQRFLARLKSQWPWLLAGLAAVAVVLGGWGIYSYFKGRQEEKAGAAWAQVRSKTEGLGAKQEILKDLETVMRDYPGTRAAQEAARWRAHLLYHQKNYAEAAKAYASLIQGRDPGWDTLIAESLSYCYEGMGDFRQAAEVLKGAADKASEAFKGELRQRLALLLELAGDHQQAATYWRQLLDHPPSPNLVPYLREKLAAATAAAAKK